MISEILSNNKQWNFIKKLIIKKRDKKTIDINFIKI